MRQKGFTMVEVLVAMVIMAFGLLGLAGQMLSSLRNNDSANQRSQATWLAYDIIDRIRTNRANALANQYDIALGTASINAGNALAISDVNGWKNALSSTLPNGDGSVSVTAATRNVTVIVQWNDARGTGGGANQQFRIDTQL